MIGRTNARNARCALPGGASCPSSPLLPCMSHIYSPTAIYSLDTSTKLTDRQARMTKRTGARAGASRWAVRTGMVGMPVTRAGDRMVVEYSMGISAEEEE